VLGDFLQLNFVVDPSRHSDARFSQTNRTQDQLPTFESALRMENAAIVHDGKFIKLVPLPEALGHGSTSVGAGEPGFGISVVPLKYISAATVAKAAEQILAYLSTYLGPMPPKSTHISPCAALPISVR
jgi:general secretion pathway protein D